MRLAMAVYWSCPLRTSLGDAVFLIAVAAPLGSNGTLSQRPSCFIRTSQERRSGAPGAWLWVVSPVARAVRLFRQSRGCSMACKQRNANM